MQCPNNCNSDSTSTTTTTTAANMASARRKQDEKNVKTLRELSSTIPANRYCFECTQRGPTYVNITIGSFVCTKCSGMLRGLTPPHRVKSISMASFTPEEIELLRARGNEYCAQVWLGLYEPGTTKPTDETGIHSLMLDKYERKRYYMEPSIALRNGVNTALSQQTTTPAPSHQQQQIEIAQANNNNTVHRLQRTNGFKNKNHNRVPQLNGFHAETNGGFPTKFNGNDFAAKFNGNGFEPDDNNGFQKNGEFVADFAHADIFNADQQPQQQQQQQMSFANFENNPIFSSDPSSPATPQPPSQADEFSIFDLQFTMCGPVYNQVQLFPKMNPHRWQFESSPMPFNNGNLNNNGYHANAFKAMTNGGGGAPPPPPLALSTVDRYAALKDLDNEIKSQTQAQLDWNTTPTTAPTTTHGGSNSSLYSSPPAGSFYASSTASPLSSSYGSPSQGGNFMNLFAHENGSASNPFSLHASFNTSSPFANPFRDAPDAFQSPPMSNGFGAPQWTPNPFKITNGHSSNPFL